MMLLKRLWSLSKMGIVALAGKQFRFPDDATPEQIATTVNTPEFQNTYLPSGDPDAGSIEPRVFTRNEDGTVSPELGLNSLPEGPLSVEDLNATADIESSGNPDAVNRFGFRGLLQLGDARAKELGVDDPFNPAASIAGYQKHAGQVQRRLAKTDHQFDGFHTYLLWQQGMTGGVRILDNQDQPINSFRYKRNMMNNQPPTREWRDIENPTVGDWVEQWRKVYDLKRSTSQVTVEKFFA